MNLRIVDGCRKTMQVEQAPKVIIASELLAAKLPEKADPSQIDIAFGRRAIPKLVPLKS